MAVSWYTPINNLNNKRWHVHYSYQEDIFCLEKSQIPNVFSESYQSTHRLQQRYLSYHGQGMLLSDEQIQPKFSIADKNANINNRIIFICVDSPSKMVMGAAVTSIWVVRSDVGLMLVYVGAQVNNKSDNQMTTSWATRWQLDDNKSDNSMTTQWQLNDNSMTTRWQLDDNSMTTRWQLDDNSMTTRWQLDDNSMTTRWQLDDNSMTTRWQLDDNSMTTRWQLDDNSMTTRWQLDDNSMTTRWQLDDNSMTTRWQLDDNSMTTRWQLDDNSMTTRWQLDDNKSDN